MKKVFSQFYAMMKAGYEVDRAWRAWKYAKEHLDKKKIAAAHVRHMKAVARMELLCKPRTRRRKDGNDGPQPTQYDSPC